MTVTVPISPIKASGPATCTCCRYGERPAIWPGWRPRFADLNTKIVRLQGAMTSAGAGPEKQHAALDELDKARIALLAMDQIQREVENAVELINRAANAPEAAEIDRLIVR